VAKVGGGWLSWVRIHADRAIKANLTLHRPPPSPNKIQKKFPLLWEVENKAKAIRPRKRLKLSFYDSVFALVIGIWRGGEGWGGTLAVYV
jgi:hypothetical protein